MKQNKIYVGNLPFGITEGALQAEFSKYGKIEELLLIKDRLTGQIKGFGFITFSSQHEAEKALEMNGKPLEGRPLKVNMAQQKMNQASRGHYR
ncbi:RNA binding protein, cold-inducible rrm [Legionella lansingensis]|uniref:RNA binding protein, cold-inducible rrm n=1 Tax=Legionella lansingensis TaxID=45067 RepID=A0A0W0VS23_9GAMM|nr:RNA-binding protein [Legionella lansingensis]KTD22883.1 RNA binding protein, cold-inducible rrm [Legionella lansingensis]SNV53766.1 RNA binding protein, cold-inducible rrm [Legionella lansingensis]